MIHAHNTGHLSYILISEPRVQEQMEAKCILQQYMLVYIKLVVLLNKPLIDP